jgi:hypothetical protein
MTISFLSGITVELTRRRVSLRLSIVQRFVSQFDFAKLINFNFYASSLFSSTSTTVDRVSPGKFSNAIIVASSVSCDFNPEIRQKFEHAGLHPRPPSHSDPSPGAIIVAPENTMIPEIQMPSNIKRPSAIFRNQIHVRLLLAND